MHRSVNPLGANRSAAAAWRSVTSAAGLPATAASAASSVCAPTATTLHRHEAATPLLSTHRRLAHSARKPPPKRSTPQAAPLSSLPPLGPNQFRVCVREMRPDEVTLHGSGGALRSQRRLLSRLSSLHAPQPSTIRIEPSRRGSARAGAEGEEVQMHTSATAPPQTFMQWLRKVSGLGVAEDAGRVLTVLQRQTGAKEWVTHCGFPPPPSSSSSSSAASPSPFSSADSSHPDPHAPSPAASHTLARVQLDALHLWLLHVRLRNDPSHGRFLHALFDAFWQSVRHQLAPHYPSPLDLDTFMRHLTPRVYGGWAAADRALQDYVFGREREEQLEEQWAHHRFGAQKQTEAGAPAPTPTGPRSAEWDATPQRDLSAADAKLLGVLWRNAYQSSRELNPRHLAQMREYVVASLEHLFLYDDDRVRSARFDWLPVPRPAPRPLLQSEAADVQRYYDALSKPLVRDQVLVTRGVPSVLRKWLHTRSYARDDSRNTASEQRQETQSKPNPTTPSTSSSQHSTLELVCA